MEISLLVHFFKDVIDCVAKQRARSLVFSILFELFRLQWYVQQLWTITEGWYSESIIHWAIPENIRTTQGGAHDLAKFRVPMIHRFMTSHPVAELLLCFRAKHKDGRPMPFGFLVVFTHRLTELCILNAENVEKVSSRPLKQMSWPNKEDLVLF